MREGESLEIFYRSDTHDTVKTINFPKCRVVRRDCCDAAPSSPCPW